MRKLLLASLFIVIAAGAMGSNAYARFTPFEVPPRLSGWIERQKAFPEGAENLKAFERLVSALKNLRYTPLDLALRQSELSLKEIEFLRSHSQGVMSLGDLITSDANLNGGYSLGIGSFKKQYQNASTRFGLKEWGPAYDEFEIDWAGQDGHTELFMAKLTSDPNRKIVFFIPPRFLSHPQANITKEEYAWLMRNPEKLKNVLFVFGAYDIVTPEIEDLQKKSTLHGDGLRALILRAMGSGPTWIENGLY